MIGNESEPQIGTVLSNNILIIKNSSTFKTLFGKACRRNDRNECKHQDCQNKHTPLWSLALVKTFLKESKQSIKSKKAECTDDNDVSCIIPFICHPH